MYTFFNCSIVYYFHLKILISKNWNILDEKLDKIIEDVNVDKSGHVVEVIHTDDNAEKNTSSGNSFILNDGSSIILENTRDTKEELSNRNMNIINLSHDELSSDNESIATESTDKYNSNNSDNSFDEDSYNSSDDELNQRIDFFSKIMFTASNLKVGDIIALITAFSLRFNLSDEAKLELANLVKYIAGPNFHDFSLSKYMMNKCFSSQEENIDYYYYCTECEDAIIHTKKAAETKFKKYCSTCSKCDKKNILTGTSNNYFISVDLKYQIKQLLSNDLIFEDILKNYMTPDNLNNFEHNVMKDVNDGILHKNIVDSHRINDEVGEIYLTINFNTDGAPLSKSNKRGFWPVQAILNNLSPKLRFSFIFLTGILIVSSEPKSNLLDLYLTKVLLEQIMFIHTDGIRIKKNNRIYTIKVCPLSCTVDSVCRPIIQNRLQFNGYSGCS